MLSRVWLFAIAWTVADQVPLSMEFSNKSFQVFAISSLEASSTTGIRIHGLPHCEQMLYPHRPPEEPTPDSLKIQPLTQSCLEWKSRMSLLCISGRWDAATSKGLPGNDCFRMLISISRWTRRCLCTFKLCKPFLGHNVLSKNVDFCICFCTDQLNLYCQRDFPSEVTSRLWS